MAGEEVTDQIENQESQAAGSGPRPRLFAAVWRWHFYAGLLVIPLIVILCLSGITYLFRPQLDGLIYGKLRNVEQGQKYVSYKKQIVAVEKAVPGALINTLGPPANPRRATEVGINTPSGADWTVYVDPYTGKVKGHRNNRNSLSTIALEVHGSLLGGRIFTGGDKWGDRLLELAASWTVILVVTGMYLWWPRGKRRGFRKALRIRRNATGGRTFWRDLHATTGVLFSFVTLFFLITGLAWSGVWGEKYNEIATKLGASYPAGTFEGVPSEKIADVVKGGKPAWAASELPVLDSKGGKPGHTGHEGHIKHSHLKWDPTNGAPIDAVVASAQSLGFPPGFSVTYPIDEKSSYLISRSPDLDPQPNQSAFNERFTYLDQYTAAPVGDFKFAQFGVMAQATDLGIALHEGRQFGLANQLLTLAATLAILLSCATAVVMWRKRKPKGIGAPRRQPNRKLGFGVVAITFALGIFMPLVGISIIVLLIFDFVIVKRIGPLARALGAR